MDPYEKLFAHVRHKEPPKGLYQAIIGRISIEASTQARRRSYLFGALSVISLGAFIPALQYAVSGLSQSGLNNYLSLLLSDGQTMLLYWKDFALAVTDSVPLMSITASLAALFVFLGSVKALVSTLRAAQGISGHRLHRA